MAEAALVPSDATSSLFLSEADTLWMSVFTDTLGFAIIALAIGRTCGGRVTEGAFISISTITSVFCLTLSLMLTRGSVLWGAGISSSTLASITGPTLISVVRTPTTFVVVGSFFIA